MRRPAITAILALLALAVPVAAQTLVLRAGHVVYPESGRVEAHRQILVEDGRIVAIAEHVDAPSGARTVDLSGSWVLPGLMDAHTHLTTEAPPPMDLHAEYLKKSSPMRALIGLRNAQDVLRAGFTAVKDIGNEAAYAAVAIRDAIRNGLFEGPTLLAAGKIIAPFGGQSHGVPLEMGPFWRFEYLDADTPDEVRKAVRQNLYYGADTIKLVADNSRFFYSEDEVRAAVEEAHRAGVTLSVHVMGGQAARNVILGGADSIEHGFALDDELLGLMKEHGTVLVGTDFPLEHLRAMGDVGGVLGEAEKTAQQILDRLARAHRLGVEMAFGTDVVVALPGKSRADMMLDYLAVWTQAGVPPADILRAMTTNAAALLRIDGDRGRIAEGYAADLVATDADPLADIEALRRIHFVMKDGRVFRGPG